MKILITAFQPFGNDTENSARLAMDLLPDKTDKHIIVRETLPVVYYKSIAQIKTLIDKHSPDAVICLGQAAGATAVRIERVAVNMDDKDFGDNDGNIHIDKEIIKGAPAAYFSTLPTRDMMDACKEKNVPAYLSYTAGNYVCNHTMYGLLDYIKDSGIIGGFIHIPSTPAQAKDKNHSPSMSSADAAKGLLGMIEAL
jgi:pyroglutamyl-peptidase